MSDALKWKKELGSSLDSRIGEIAERANRRLTRRTALRAGMLSSVAGLAAIAVGENPAAAATSPNYPYSPGCGPTRSCSGCGYPDGCPGGYELCLEKYACKNDYSGSCCYCEWPGGIWESADNLGRGGHGFTLCYDCVRSPANATNCKTWCTCASACFCCNCTTIEDIRAEQKKVGLYYSAVSKRGIPEEISRAGG